MGSPLGTRGGNCEDEELLAAQQTRNSCVYLPIIGRSAHIHYSQNADLNLETLLCSLASYLEEKGVAKKDNKTVG